MIATTSRRAGHLRFYLAARYSRREEMLIYAAELTMLGVGDVHARWLDGEHEWDGTQERGAELERAQRFALDDMEDLGKADVVVVFTEQPGAGGRNRGGRHVEYGLAVGWRKHVVVVGDAENVFHTLPFIPRFRTWQEALVHLIKLPAQAIRAKLLQ